ncbi:hypothetical protein RUND412_007649 [Rhizina undulata]
MTSPALRTPPPPLPPLPDHKALSKRPLLHPPIPRPTASSQKIIYISATTPFASAATRIRKLLLLESPSNGQRQPRRGNKSKEARQERDAASGEEGVVRLKATGRAVEKALHLGAYFRSERTSSVHLQIGGIDVVDDIVDAPPHGHKRKRKACGAGGGGKRKKREGEGETVGEVDDGEEETKRLRKTSFVEVVISRKR